MAVELVQLIALAVEQVLLLVPPAELVQATGPVVEELVQLIALAVEQV